MQVAIEPESDGEHEPEANVQSEPESAASDHEGPYPGYSDWDESDDEDFPHDDDEDSVDPLPPLPPLLEAAASGDLEILLSLLNTGVEVNRDYGGTGRQGHFPQRPLRPGETSPNGSVPADG